MSRGKSLRDAAAATSIRCAIYTRKSTEDGLEQEFNSLDAQRESAEAYIRSQQHEGWRCLPEAYDDGGFSGGSMDRPALRRLLADIEAGRIDCVVVYKVDRLSRSLLDFARILEVFERHRVAFVSVTQQFNTTSSMGRLMLNVLLSFAQFEREIISERTRDKIAATRRKGKWSGGRPLLGYDVDPQGLKLTVNSYEADRVKAIFQWYLDHPSMIEMLRELDRRGWVNKRWTSRRGDECGGQPFTKASLFRLLTNVVYVGKVKYKDEVHPGEHEAIIAPDLWQRVQSQLRRNGRSGGMVARNKFGALLKGLLRCAACDCAMSPSHSTRHGTKRYRYYVCVNAQKRGWHNCPSKSVPAPEMERFVVDQIRAVAQDPQLLDRVVTQVGTQAEAQRTQLEMEQRGLKHDLAQWYQDIHHLTGQIRPHETNSPAVARLADLHERVRGAERRATEIREQILAIRSRALDEEAMARALSSFLPLWDSLTVREQIRIVHLLVQRVDYDGRTSKVAITFRSSYTPAKAEEATV